MAYLLNLESSTEVCSVSLSKDRELIDYIENDEGQSHARLLSVFAEDLLKRNNISFQQLSAVAVSKGPGSYTGLRIGVSLAKGICYANNIPLIAICPLKSMTWHIVNNLKKYNLEKESSLLFAPMIDARRMEVYTTLFDNTLKEISPVSADIIDENSFNPYLNDHKLVLFGNGSDKCRQHLGSSNVLFIEDIKTSAQFMCSLSYKAFENNDFVDLAYFEPFYLKDFVAGKPKKNILKT